MTVRAADSSVFIVDFATGASHAFWMCWRQTSGMVVVDSFIKAFFASSLSSSVARLYDGGRMDYWRASFDAADARKAEGDSIVAFLIPNPLFRRGSVVCNHWSSLKSILRMLVKPDLRFASNVSSCGWWWQSDVLSVYSRRGMLMLFLSNTSASWAWRRLKRPIARSRSSIFFWRALSKDGPLRIGAPKRVMSSFCTLMKSLKCVI